ncbi:hypothetical protein NMY22_g699 [Coprinellus aureogranulatus]|nr:hypothetical protein NMY22_g699 [Coprinellus aureogranulatus]
MANPIFKPSDRADTHGGPTQRITMPAEGGKPWKFVVFDIMQITMGLLALISAVTHAGQAFRGYPYLDGLHVNVHLLWVFGMFSISYWLMQANDTIHRLAYPSFIMPIDLCIRSNCSHYHYCVRRALSATEVAVPFPEKRASTPFAM